MSHNDITGDKIKSKVNSDKFRDNWDKVFGKKEVSVDLGKKDVTKIVQIENNEDGCNHMWEISMDGGTWLCFKCGVWK